MSLSIKEFRVLARLERERRYIELSSHDKFIARMEDWSACDGQIISTEEFIKHPPKGWESITQEDFDKMFPDEKHVVPDYPSRKGTKDPK